MKIALVGTAVGEMEAPFNDKNFEIWCMNWNTPKYPRVTRDFEIHKFRKNQLVEPEIRPGIETIHQDNFPHEWIEKKFPRYLNNYLYKSSMDYMMAYALYLHKTAKTKKDKVELVQIHGVHMALDNDEYFHQQPSFTGWISYALAHFDVIIDERSPLLKTTNVYGLGEPIQGDSLYNLHTFRTMKEREEKVLQELRQDMKTLEDKIHTHNGNMQAWDLLLRTERAKLAGQKINSLDDLVQSVK